MHEFQKESPIRLAWQGQVWPGKVGRGDYGHRFGGPLDVPVRRMPPKQPSLHRVVTLDLSDSRLNIPMAGLTVLPLLYGFVYDACTLEYKIVSDTRIDIVRLSPKRASDDWPYQDYPSHFREKPIRFSRPLALPHDEIMQLSCQGLPDDAADKLVVIVVPSSQFGVSLWGEWGDAEEVEVIFVVDPATGRVSVSNQCT